MRLALVLMVVASAGVPSGAASGRVVSLSAEAQKLYDQGQYQAALQTYQQALLEDPENPSLRYNEGSAHYKTGDYEAALQTFRQLGQVPDAPLAARSLYNAGNTLYQQQDFSGAAAAYTAALESAPDDLDARANLELSLRRLQEQQQRQQQQGGPGQRQQGGEQQPQPGQQDGEQDQQPQDERQQDQQQGDEQAAPQPDQDRQTPPAGDQGSAPEQRGQGSQVRPGDEGMNPEEAARLLDALQDRDRQAQFRRFRVPAAPPPARDW
ncbi:MAG: tetratricopeptide repeat protein [Gemmatimonadota bacterium]